MEVYPVEHTALLNDEVRDVAEEVRQGVHLVNDLVDFLFFDPSHRRVCLLDLFDQLLLLILFVVTLDGVVQVALVWNAHLSLDAVEFSNLLDVVSLDLP